MSFLAPKTELPSDLSVNTPGRSTRGSPTEVLPWVRGRGRCVVRWMTPVLHWHFRNTSQSSFAFFSCYGWIAHGPADEIAAIVVNGKGYSGVAVFRAATPGDFYDHVIAKETPETFRFWWGTAAQVNYTAYLQSLVRDPAHPMKNVTHPTYKNIFAVACKDVEAGRADGGRTPPLPQIEIVFHKRAEKTFSQGYAPHGCSALGIAHDLLTSQRGGARLPAANLNTAQWDAKILQLHDTGIAGKAGTDTWISTILDQPRPLGDHLADILAHVDGHTRERDGKLEVDFFPSDGSTANPAGLREISEHERDGEIELDPAGLDQLKTKVIVTGLEWNTEPPLSEASEDAQVPYAVKLLNGEQRPPENIARSGFTTRTQLKAYAELRAAMLANPELRAIVPVLRQYATQPDNITPLRPGDRFNLDDDEKALDLVVRILERHEDGARVIFKVVGERGAFPQPYQPALDPRANLTTPAPADLARYAVAQLPPDLSDAGDTLVAALVERPSNSTTSFEVHMAPTNAWPGQILTTNASRFAVCAVLQTALASDLADATITINTVGNDWSYLRSQSALEQADNALLMFRGNEWFSIGTITPLGGGSYTLAIKRARLGSLPAAHAIGVVLFLIPRADLISLAHAEFAKVEAGGVYDAATATKWFKLRPNGAGGLQGNLTAAFSLQLRDPTPDQVTGLSATTGTGKVVDLKWNAVPNALVFEYEVVRATGPGFVDEAFIGEADSTRFIDTRVTLGVQYRYRVRAVTTDETEGAYSATVLATPGVITGGEVDNTPPSNATGPSLVSQTVYFSRDGTEFTRAEILMRPLPAGAYHQQLLYRRSGVSTDEWLLASPHFNTADKTVRLDDLTPGTTYDFAAQAFSFFGVPSAIVQGVSSPFTAIGRTAGPGVPTNPVFSKDDLPLAFYVNTNLRMFGVRLSWDFLNDRTVADYEIRAVPGSGPHTDGQKDAGTDLGTPIRVRAKTHVFYSFDAHAGRLYLRAWDKSGFPSAWVDCGNPGSPTNNWFLSGGNMGEQNSDAVVVTAQKTGGSTARNVRARYVDTEVFTLVGGGPSEDFSRNISANGFPFKPDEGTVKVTGSDNGNFRELDATYVFDHGSNTNLIAYFTIFRRDGGNLVNQLVRVSIEFIEHE